MASKRQRKKVTVKSKKRAKISQTDVPSYSLEKALFVPRAIADHYAYKPTAPLQVAAALEKAPNSSQFRMLCGAAIAYGLTKGGPNAPFIEIDAIGMRIVKSPKNGDDSAARREAMLKPRVVSEFLRKYNKAPLPREDIALNILREMGVPEDRAKNVLELIIEGARAVGFLQEIRGKQYIHLEGVDDLQPPSSDEESSPEISTSIDDTQIQAESPTEASSLKFEQGSRRVFITHGGNKALVEPIRKLLAFGELEAVVSVDRQSVSQPVPDKVMNDMRGCGAAIIHVDAEQRLLDQDAKEHIVLNANVLIEIGAAMALYGRRFILLVKKGVDLPSNLQGLYEVRYSEDKLDGETTIKLLEAINDIKNHKLPERFSN